jgi:tetratricopeptide (TPR) repeat protein
MKPLSCLPLILVSFIACHSPSGNSARLLNDNNLYVPDTVRMAASGGDEKEAGRTLQEALNLYKKGSDTAGSIALFKRSIFTKPTAKAYFELAGALLATRQYEEGINALSIAEKLGYTPLANIMFRYAYAYANYDSGEFSMQHLKQATKYVELAIQMGYARPAQFQQRNIFPTLPNYYGFASAYVNALAGGPGIDPEKGLWNSYVSQFPEVPLPFAIDQRWIAEHALGVDISFQYEKFIPEIREAKFSRGGGDSYFGIGLLHKEAEYILLIYGVEDQTIENAFPAFLLVSYDTRGRIIDRMPVAGRKDLTENFRSFLMRPDLSFQVQEFRTTYAKDPDSVGYDSSNINRQEALQPVDFHVTAAGKFEKMGSPLASR